ncbi:MAG: hypothetical protein R3F17_12885 [Planctomycetota bacterium]
MVEIDFSRQLMSLHDPEAFDGSRVTWRSLRFDGSTPCVYCEFAPQEGGWFRLDSGSDDTVTFHAPWVRRLSLLRHMHNTVQTRLRGIGGEVRGVQGRFPWFEFLGQRFSDPRVTMVEEATGPSPTQTWWAMSELASWKTNA